MIDNRWRRGFIFAFSATLFCSASLMFCIQPLVGKLLLPRLGGSPQVWNTCMVFFQGMLFAGYLHAHYTGMLLGLRWQAIVHLLLAAAALFALPIGLTSDAAPQHSDSPIVWLMQILLASVGLPMFVVSTTAPLVQKWFSHTHHPNAQDPYFLYVASNLGSLLALVCYPTIIEPLLDLGQQAKLLSGGFATLVVLLTVCAFLFHKNYSNSPQRHSTSDASNIGALDRFAALRTEANLQTDLITWRQRLRWLLLSFAPSSLLLGVTTYITTDVTTVPLFWVIPLAIYLLTFVLAFARRPPIAHDGAVRGQTFFVIFLAVFSIAAIPLDMWGMLTIHLLVFFSCALVCHGELVAARPNAAQLTEFYLWLSLGGVLGGAFNTLAAPGIFSEPFEYPLIIALTCMLRPSIDRGGLLQKWCDLLLPLAFLGAILLAINGLPMLLDKAIVWHLVLMAGAVIGPSIVAIIFFAKRPIRFGLGVAAILVGVPIATGVSDKGEVRLAGPVLRSFFGVYKIYHSEKLDLNLFLHGTTNHGVQSRSPALANEPLSYYYRNGAFGDMFVALAEKVHDGNVAIAGLGAGGLTCYGAKGSRWTYYEIDPLVEKIARDSRYFTYLRDCPPKVNVVIGDARLMLQRAPERYYDLMVLDVFSSDAIPTHLLTREAIATYLAKLAPNGVLAVHITSRYLNLEPVLGNLARSASLVGRINRDMRGDEGNHTLYSAARLVLLARQEEDLGSIANDSRWRPLISRPDSRVWSDDYVNILSVLESPVL